MEVAPFDWKIISRLWIKQIVMMLRVVYRQWLKEGAAVVPQTGSIVISPFASKPIFIASKDREEVGKTRSRKVRNWIKKIAQREKELTQTVLSLSVYKNWISPIRFSPLSPLGEPSINLPEIIIFKEDNTRPSVLTPIFAANFYNERTDIGSMGQPWVTKRQ